MRIVASNRFRPGFAEIVAPMSQFGLCVVDVAGLTFDEAIRRARGRALSANKNAYYDMDGLAELLATVRRDRGEEIDLSVFFNDRRGPIPPTGAVPTAAAVRAARPRTTLTWEKQERRSGPHLMLHINDTVDDVVMFAEVDCHHLSRPDAEAILREMEGLVIDHALDGGAPSAVATGETD
jgi:hypothetical protein